VYLSCQAPQEAAAILDQTGIFLGRALQRSSKLLILVLQTSNLGCTIKSHGHGLAASVSKANARPLDTASGTHAASLSSAKEQPVITKAIIVLGASAGGVEALVRLCQEFPADFAGTMFIAQHISPSSRSVLPQLLDRSGHLP